MSPAGAVQYLLHSYASSANINEAIARLRSTIQRADETEHQYSSRLSNAFVHCGNVYSSSEKIQFFVDGLDPAIKSLVIRHREADRRRTFLELVQFAQAKGDAIRARERRRSSRLQVSPAKRTAHPQRALFAEEKQHSHHSSTETTEQYSATDMDVENLNLVGDYGSSVPTSDLPTSNGSSQSTNSSDPALAIGYGKQYRQSGSRSGRMPAPRVPRQALAGMAQQRPGWVNREEQDAQRANPSWIFYTCCAKGVHTAPNCTLSLRNISKVIAN